MPNRLCLGHQEYHPLSDFNGPAVMCRRAVAEGLNAGPPARRGGAEKRETGKRGMRAPRPDSGSASPPRRSVEGLKKRKRYNRARERAKTALARKYQREYERLLAKELRKEESA